MSLTGLDWTRLDSVGVYARVEQKLHYLTWRLFCLQGQVTQPSIYCTLIQDGTEERAKKHCVALQWNLKAQERINSKLNVFHLPV